MKIKEVTRTVYVGHNDQEFLSREAAEDSIIEAMHKQKIEDLATLLHRISTSDPHEISLDQLAEDMCNNITDVARALNLQFPLFK